MITQGRLYHTYRSVAAWAVAAAIAGGALHPAYAREPVYQGPVDSNVQLAPPATAPLPASAPVPHRPLPIGSNDVNQPLLPGNERTDYFIRPYVQGHPLVLMAISGGGSRSSYYAARVMQELANVPLPGIENGQMPDGRPMYSLLDSVRVISTVSAGGLAASYYALNHEQRKSPDFFEKFRNTMGVNLQWRTYGHMAMFPPLAVQLLASSVTRTDLLADEIDKLLGGKKVTFNDLRMRETNPLDPPPMLLINGTIYNSGQRLVMTNLPSARFPKLMAGDSGPRVVLPERDKQILNNLMQPLTFADLGSDIGTFPLSRALAASAAYPVLLAPVPLRIFPQNVPSGSLHRVDQKLLQSEIAYITDGGIYENEGVDPLLSLVRSLGPKQPVLIIILDGSQRMETLNLGEGERWGPVRSMGRMYDIGTLKPLAHYRSLIGDFHDTDKLEMVFVRMEGYDEPTQAKLRDIPTTFKLSDKHQTMLNDTAVENFARIRQPIVEAYQRLTGKPKPTPKRATAKSSRK